MKEDKQETQAKKVSLLKGPRYNLGPLTNAAMDVLHLYGGHDGGCGGGKITD